LRGAPFGSKVRRSADDILKEFFTFQPVFMIKLQQILTVDDPSLSDIIRPSGGLKEAL